MNENIQRRFDRVTAKQKQILVEFMEDHADFARGKLLGVEGKITSNSLWQVLCQQLHAYGPEKSVTKWQRVWTDIKINVKRKASGNASSRRKTGGGPPEETPLDDFDEKVVSIMSQTAVYGIHGDVPLDSEEPGFNYDITSNIHKKSLAEPVPGPSRELPSKKRIFDPSPTEWAESVPGPSRDHIREPPLKKRAIDPSPTEWTNIVDRMEAEESRTTDQSNESYLSPIYSEASVGRTNTTPRRRSQGFVSQAAQELKDLSKQNTAALTAVEVQLKNLNDNVNVIINQNQEIMQERKNTNNFLERIAQALEGQYL